MHIDRLKVGLKRILGRYGTILFLCSCTLLIIFKFKSVKWNNLEVEGMWLEKDNFSVVEDKKISDMLSTHEGSILRRFPFPMEPLCRNFSLNLFEDDTFPLVGLVSYPGSGNTWTRHLIQLATGVYTGSFYFDITLYAAGFVGEKEIWHSGRTIVQKFHEKFNKRMYLDKAILLIREPFPAIMSFANYLEGGHTGKSYSLPYHHKDWSNFLLHSTYSWLSLAKSWIEASVKLLVIYYEDLRLHPVENVRKMCDFLNNSCPYLGSPCFMRELNGSFKRKSGNTLKETTNNDDRYPNSVQSVINRGIDHLNDLLRQNRLEPIPLHLYKYYRSQ